MLRNWYQQLVNGRGGCDGAKIEIVFFINNNMGGGSYNSKDARQHAAKFNFQFKKHVFRRLHTVSIGGDRPGRTRF